jgi:hypothetical protein
VQQENICHNLPAAARPGFFYVLCDEASYAGKSAKRVFAPEHNPDDPRVSSYLPEKQFRKPMQCRVKPGNDAVIGAALRSCRRRNAGFHTWRDPRSRLKSPD